MVDFQIGLVAFVVVLAIVGVVAVVFATIEKRRKAREHDEWSTNMLRAEVHRHRIARERGAPIVVYRGY